MTLPSTVRVLLAAAALGAAVAASAPGGVAWSSLTPAQREVLAPLQSDWAGIEANRQQKWLEVARRFPSLPAAERERIQQRMADWARLTPAERGRARVQFLEAQQISPADRQARWEAYRALPPEEREALAQKAQARRAAKPAVAPEPRATEVAAKRNVVSPTRQAVVKPVAPAVVQAKPGATTSVVNARPPQPAHQQPGLPKVAATRDFVNQKTLLPQRGPQGAAVQAPESDRHPDRRP